MSYMAMMIVVPTWDSNVSEGFIIECFRNEAAVYSVWLQTPLLWIFSPNSRNCFTIRIFLETLVQRRIRSPFLIFQQHGGRLCWAAEKLLGFSWFWAATILCLHINLVKCIAVVNNGGLLLHDLEAGNIFNKLWFYLKVFLYELKWCNSWPSCSSQNKQKALMSGVC